MFRRAMTFGAMLVLGGAAVLMTASPVQAQHGGHGGGFRSGGGFHSGGIGGYHSGYHHRGYSQGFGYRPYRDYRHYYRGYYPYYGYYPDYGSAIDYPYYNDSYLYGGYDSPENSYAGDSPVLRYRITYDSGTKGLSKQEVQADAQAGIGNYAGAATPVDTTAHVTVRVPADAVIWLDDTKMTSTGSTREYQSPPLTPGSRYTYDIRARWNENGHEVTQRQQVEFTAGSRVNVHFPMQETKAPTAPSR